jgi:hypothetical protein
MDANGHESTPTEGIRIAAKERKDRKEGKIISSLTCDEAFSGAEAVTFLRSMRASALRQAYGATGFAAIKMFLDSRQFVSIRG